MLILFVAESDAGFVFTLAPVPTSFADHWGQEFWAACDFPRPPDNAGVLIIVHAMPSGMFKVLIVHLSW